MPKRSDFVDFVIDQLAPLGAVRAKSMFGGFGVYLDELMFAIIVDDSLYFKVDALSREEFAALGLQPFTYAARGKTVTMQYYAAPPEVFESPEAMHDWAQRAVGAALRARKKS
ncbi:MAG: TfoX/Sxy family protein [Sulfuricella sp.]|nr:TfoX/Sxy family protein [Sulfuricella sp.]